MAHNEHYTLDEITHEIKPVDLMTWAAWMDKPTLRRVAETTIGDVRISTVFLGLDFGFDESPQLFETMIFGGEHDQYQTRCSTYDEAITMHDDAVEVVKN